MKRRLTAVVCADVVGYSKMMRADEAGTLASLKAHRAALDPVILNYGGRVVKTTGDGLLLEFPSIVGAVNAAIRRRN
jgi:adenylate cyclase